MHGENSLTRFYLLGCYRGPSTTRADSLRMTAPIFRDALRLLHGLELGGELVDGGYVVEAG